jgi:hypothetical protein
MESIDVVDNHQDVLTCLGDRCRYLLEPEDERVLLDLELVELIGNFIRGGVRHLTDRVFAKVLLY